MHFLPTDDQRELQRGVRDVLAGAFPLEALPGGWTPALWRTLADTGVFTLRSDLGAGLAEAALVYEELGRAAVPGPLVGSFLLGRPQPVTVIDAQSHPVLATHLAVASSVLVLDGAIASTVAAADVRGKEVARPVDPLTPLTEVSAVPSGAPVDDADRLRAEGALLTAALQVGIATRLTELAVDYAKGREQFGRPIGSFQAVKHLCADMFVRAELARVAVHAAAVLLDDGSDEAARAVAGAKLLADEAATGNGRGAVQVHGGMGFTWEVPVHFFAKRAWLHATEFGTADDHAEAVAALVVT